MSRYHKFMRGWAQKHGVTYSQARRSPVARAYYKETSGRGKRYALRAWAMAGVMEWDEDAGEWRYNG